MNFKELWQKRREFMLQACAKGGRAGRGKKLGDENPARRPEVREQIRKTVQEGYYEGKKMGFGKVKGYRNPITISNILIKLERCEECGSKDDLVLHHIDGNHQNNLLTNLQVLCGSCHVAKQYKPYFRLYVKTGFSAAHQLKKYNGKCRNLHGHNFTVTVTLGGRPDKYWIVFDFAKVKEALKPIIEKLDHSFLNEKLFTDMPTTEWLLIWLFQELNSKLKGLKEITVEEGDSTGITLDDSFFVAMIGYGEGKK